MTSDRSVTDSWTADGLSGVRADKDLLRAAARELRHTATQGYYRGLQRPEYAYALASVLDMFELRWTEQDGPVREEIRRCCRTLLDRDGDTGPGRSD